MSPLVNVDTTVIENVDFFSFYQNEKTTDSLVAITLKTFRNRYMNMSCTK